MSEEQRQAAGSAAAEEASANGEVVQGPVRPLPETRDGGVIEPWRGEVKTAAIAAAGGLVAGVATVVMVRAARGNPRAANPIRRGGRRSEPAKVIASRSFLVDIHVLGK